MHPFDELCSYVDFTADDGRALAAFREPLAGDITTVVGAFYDAIDAHPGAKAVLATPGQRQRLEVSLIRWIEELLTGPFDHAYHARRLVIGRVHVRVRLPSQYMFTAMNVLRRGLTDAARRSGESDAAVEAFCLALHKMLDIELAIMLGAYMEHEQRRKLETFRDLIMGTLPIAVVLLDEDNKIAALTTPLKDVLQPQAQVGHAPQDAFEPEFLSAADLERRLAQIQTRGQQLLLPRITLQGADGPRHLRATIVPVKHDVARMLLHFEDLTDAIQTEARMHQQQHLAQLGVMSAAVAHEIRNPLTGIATTVQVIAAGMDDDDERKKILGKVYDQTHRLSTQLTELLRFARPADVKLASVDLDTIVRRACESLEHPQRTHVHVSGEGRAHADADVLARGVLNLLKNAFEAGATRVDVTLQSAQILIADDGPGIPETLRNKVYEPFFTTKTRGTGLGLAITHRALANMGGDLSLVETDSGTCFRLRLADDGAREVPVGR